MSTKLEFDVLANDRASSKLDKIGGAFGRFGRNANDAGGKAGGALSKLGGGLLKFGKFAAIGLAGVGVGLVAVAPKIFGAAANLELLGKKSKTVFGSEIGNVEKWAKANANAMGLTSREATGLAAGFGDLLIPMGFTRKEAADMSTKVLGLSGALAEWSGGTRTAAEVSEILSAAMLGERDALKGLGISITEADVKARLLKNGQDKLTGSALQQAQAIATQQLIMEKSTDAQAAFAKGGDSLARKMEVSKAKVKEMGQELLVTATPALKKIADLIAKFVLPQLQRFTDWFAGPGKFVMVSWALEAGGAMIDFADKTLGALQSMLGGLSKYARVALIAAAGSVAVFNPGMAVNMLKQADALSEWAKDAKDGIGGARKELQGWKSTLARTNTKVKMEANIADLERKLKTAKTQLADKNLTKARRAQLEANKRDLDNKLNAAYRQLGNPALVKARVAQLQANKTDLDRKIAAAQAALKAKGLTATKTAQLKANISQLQAAKRQAQASINSLQGKTVTVNATVKYRTVGKPQNLGSNLPGFAHGGRVHAGRPIIVGEKRPEVFVPDTSGTIIPSVPKAMGTAMGGGGPASVVLDIRSGGSELDDLLVKLLRKAIRLRGGNVQAALGTGR
jgi:hypothetical protein